MSLINEALKKAQHQRTGSALDAPPMPGGGSAVHRGSRGMPQGTLVLLIAGAAVVVVISVVATVYFVNRAPASKVAAVAPASSPPVTAAGSKTGPAPSPVIIAPVIIKAPLPVVETPVATSGVAATQPSPSSAQPNDETHPSPPAEAGSANPAPAAAVATAPGAAPTAPPVPEGSLADRIADYVDKLRVTGIRTSETGSKVLMNDKVYRVNDIVNRGLGLKLVKIEPDSLTFADAKGETYVKNF